MQQTAPHDKMTPYTQENGETTALLPDAEEVMVLAHTGSRPYKQVFYLLVAGGLLYLIYVFLAY